MVGRESGKVCEIRGFEMNVLCCVLMEAQPALLLPHPSVKDVWR